MAVVGGWRVGIWRWLGLTYWMARRMVMRGCVPQSTARVRVWMWSLVMTCLVGSVRLGLVMMECAGLMSWMMLRSGDWRVHSMVMGATVTLVDA